MMRICFLAAYPPQQGGVPVHAKRLAEALSEKNEVFVITYGRLGRKSKKNLHVIEVPVIPVRFFRGLSFFIGSLILLPMLTRKRKIDIIHAHYLHPCGTVAVFFRKLSGSGARIVSTAHGSDVLKLGKGIITRKLLSAVGNSCDSVVCVSEYIAKRAKEAGISGSKIRVIHNGIDSGEFPKASKAALRKELGLPPEKKIVCFAGSLSESKGADIFALLAKDLVQKHRRRHHSLFFIMAGGGKLEVWLKNFFRENGMEDSVLLAGPQDHGKALRYIKSSDIVVVPSRVEGFGLTALEGMALGVPVIATPEGSLPEILSGLSISKDMLKTADEVLLKSRFRSSMIKKNRALSGKYTLRLSVNETEKLYESLLRNP